MKRTLVLCLMLTGCAVAPPITLPQAESNCGATEFRYYGACIRQQFDTQYQGWQSDHEADLAELYIAWLEAAGKRVEQQEMTEEDATLGAKMLRVRLYEIVTARRGQAALNQQAAMASMLTGLALLNATQPAPPQTIVCNSNSFGGNTTTICN